MDFKRINTREIILISVAVFLIVMTIILNSKSKNTDVPNNQIQLSNSSPDILKQPESVGQHLNVLALSDELIKPINNLKSEDDESVQKEMGEQMDKDRNQQRQIKMLKMQLEQINLQLDNEKALTEINKLKKENAGYVKDSNSQAGIDFPNIRVIYIGGTDIEKEAILSIDGTSYSVKEKDRPVVNVEILSITDKGIKVHFSTPQELTTVINYIQD